MQISKVDKFTRKRTVNILKDRECTFHRLRRLLWQKSTSDVQFRLACLVQFSSVKTNRQIYNHAKVSIGDTRNIQY